MFEVELYLSSTNRGLNNGIFIVNYGHVGIKEHDCFFLDNILNIEKGFKAIFTKWRKTLANIGRICNWSAINDLAWCTLFVVEASGKRAWEFFCLNARWRACLHDALMAFVFFLNRPLKRWKKRIEKAQKSFRKKKSMTKKFLLDLAKNQLTKLANQLVVH